MDIKHVLENSNLSIPKDNILYNEDMKKHTTFKIGGPAECFIKIKTEQELKEILVLANENNIDAIVEYAKKLSASLDSIISISGPIDVVADKDKAYVIRNGHKMMAGITGTGCMLSSVIGVFISANPENILEATAVAVSSYGYAGELAYEKTVEMDGSYNTLRMNLIDYMAKMNDDLFRKGAKIEIR